MTTHATKTLTSSAPSRYRYRGFHRLPYQRSPDRAKSKLRRQMLAATSPMPPHLAAHLTPSQLAYARLLSDEHLRASDCRLCLDEIAARCGTCSKTIQRAQQRLKELRLVEVEHRPNEGEKHDTNIVRIISPEWLTWIAMGKIPKRIGGQRCLSTANNLFLKSVISQLEQRRAAVDKPVEVDPDLAAALGRLERSLAQSNSLPGAAKNSGDGTEGSQRRTGEGRSGESSWWSANK